MFPLGATARGGHHGGVRTFPLPFLATLLLPVLPAQAPDWLLDATPYTARADRTDGDRGLVLDNGLVRARFSLQPDAALVSLETGPAREQRLRAVRPFGRVQIDGKVVPIGGLVGQPNHAFLLPEWLQAMTADPAAFHCSGVTLAPIAERFPWRRTRPAAADAHWPPRGVHAVFAFAAPPGLAAGIALSVHVELYDGLPLLATWFELRVADAAITVDTFTSVQLALVEAESRVEPERMGVQLPDLHVETDYAFHAMTGADGSAHCVRWLPDPDYATQVNYERRTRCLLEVGPDLGPAATVAPGATFAAFRTFLLFHDGDRERRDLAIRRMYRTLAPWCTENPLMLHLRTAEPAAVRAAVEQCAATGFEMVILSFGSGFDIEDDSPANLARWRELADFAHARGVQIGGYSLLSSRRIEPDGDNCIDRATGKPGGQVFGYAPALASGWGERYFAKLRRFFEHTGFDLLEHDGSYPGDRDAAPRPPRQRGWDDSQWVQHAIVADFYRWCRGRGIYLNVPDWYFLQGSNKTGMGYRETNWSLPREQQLVHCRQNLFDGTRQKTPSMGWMFVPLSEYHGGGAAATIEPLSAHQDHYERMFAANFGYGAQACWRGPRLYDGDATANLVRQQVQWFNAHRAVLEADVVHGSSRRACGRALDWVLHVAPGREPCAMLVVFNPTAAAVAQTLPLELYYAGLQGSARVVGVDGEATIAVDARGRAALPMEVPAGAARWYALHRVAR